MYNTKNKSISIRCTQQEYEIIKERSKGHNTISNYILDTLIPERNEGRIESNRNHKDLVTKVKLSNDDTGKRWIIVSELWGGDQV